MGAPVAGVIFLLSFRAVIEIRVRTASEDKDSSILMKLALLVLNRTTHHHKTST